MMSTRTVRFNVAIRNRGWWHTFLQLHGEIQIGPCPVAIFKHWHLEDQLMDILNVFIAPSLDGGESIYSNFRSDY